VHSKVGIIQREVRLRRKSNLQVLKARIPWQAEPRRQWRQSACSTMCTGEEGVSDLDEQKKGDLAT